MRTNATRVLIGAAIAAAAGVSVPAMATTGYLSPAGAITATGTGAITKSGVTVTCQVTFNATLSGSSFTIPPAVTVGSVSSGSFTPGSALCTTVTMVSTPWNIQVNSASSSSADLTFVGVHLHTTALGDCTGNLQATFTPPNTLSFPAFTMTGTNPATTCTSNGFSLTMSPDQTINITSP